MGEDPIKWVTKYEQIERMIRERIAKGELKPGDKLESEEVIAGKLGVHRFTVNKALASLVREGLLRRVQGRGTFVAETNGQPQAGSVAVLYSSTTDRLPKDMFFGNILRGLREESGVDVTLLGMPRSSGGLPGPPLDQINFERFSGLVLLEVFDEEYIAKAKKASPVPLVVIDFDPQRVAVDHAVQDNYGAGKQATQYLQKLGHKRIAHVGEPPASKKQFVDSAWQERRRGWEDAMASSGLSAEELDRLFLQLPGRGWPGAPEHMKAILSLPPDRRPTGIFCATDDIAMYMMRTALEAGASVPGDFSFIGFGGSEAGPLMRPSLTTFIADVSEMGRWAFRRLKALREGADPMPQRHVIPVKMIERESCGRNSA
ncbi:MAG: substrate-binding domain-containing protein [Planctomycetota bacterium]|nr:substrate-binding domain-containing protein [Planctomycetota bacterium]